MTLRMSWCFAHFSCPNFPTDKWVIRENLAADDRSSGRLLEVRGGLAHTGKTVNLPLTK
jgi:hypothetical protein